MTLTQRHVNGATVLDLAGPLRGPGAHELVEHVRGVLDAGHRRLVLNLAGVPAVDAAGLGALAQTLTLAGASGGTLRLAGITHRINDLLVVTRLLTAFEAFETLEQALEPVRGEYDAVTSSPREACEGLGAVPSF